MPVTLTLLGTGSPLPDPDRAGPATLVQAGGTNLLVDAGRGVVLRLAGAGMFPSALHAVLLTHLHSDHVCSLNDVVTSHWITSPVPAALAIHGPVGTAEVVAGMLQMLAPDVGYRLDHHADLTQGPDLVVTEHGPGASFEVGPCTVTTHATDHRPVEPTIGYRIEHEGTVVALAGDTVPCAGLDELCAGADAYVQTVIRDDLVAMVPSPRLQDILDYHSTVAQAGETAARNGVGTLVLTHYVPALQPGQEEQWRAIAAEHFAGPIVLGDDLTSVTV
ncbi:MAG TPA: MBL fold metallo-hydrolase [Acidimicrobiales bacterium]|nr:MBL fold metallo-hydrolase [Acidimicrobiales bacterium]